MYLSRDFWNIASKILKSSGASMRMMAPDYGMSPIHFREVLLGDQPEPTELEEILSTFNKMADEHCPEVFSDDCFASYVIKEKESKKNKKGNPSLTKKGRRILSRHLKANDFTPLDVAAILGISVCALSYRLNGRVMPRGGEVEFDKMIAKIEEHYGFEPGDLLKYKSSGNVCPECDNLI